VPLQVLRQLAVPQALIDEVIAGGRARSDGGNLVLTRAGRLLADGISLELLSAAID
jgi:hypothetical protein